ncbi:hypothetical protein [Streptomyces sp. NPDC057694]|uniref:hypothetical protein n=1 Tax=Streptomyces sp. NPDC057694 TaxID=3346216 RepID=UPI0036B8FE75
MQPLPVQVEGLQSPAGAKEPAAPRPEIRPPFLGHREPGRLGEYTDGEGGVVRLPAGRRLRTL